MPADGAPDRDPLLQSHGTRSFTRGSSGTEPFVGEVLEERTGLGVHGDETSVDHEYVAFADAVLACSFNGPLPRSQRTSADAEIIALLKDNGLGAHEAGLLLKARASDELRAHDYLHSLRHARYKQQRLAFGSTRATSRHHLHSLRNY